MIRGAWLPEETREALAELLRCSSPASGIDMVVTASTWASPHTLLEVSDRRLRLLDDAVTHRVRFLDYGQCRRDRPPARLAAQETANLRVDLRNGRRLTFADLRPEAAAAIALHVRERLRRGRARRE